MYKEAINSILFSKVITLAATVAVIAGMILPFVMVHAASSNYSFTMSRRVVDGCDNNQFHTLDSGTAKLSGNTSAGISTIDVKYELKRDVFGRNPSYGSVNGGVNQSFSNLSFPRSVSSDNNFCIIAYRNGYDVYTVTGSGTLHN